MGIYNKGKALSTIKLIFFLIISSIIVRIGVELFISAKWIEMISEKAYVAILSARLVAQLVMIPVQVITIFALEKFSRPYFEKYLIQEEESDE